MEKKENIDYLVVGHIANDIVEEDRRTVGTVVFSALMARKLGYKVGVVTTTADLELLDVLDGISVHVVPSKTTTTLVDTLLNPPRSRKVVEIAPFLTLNHIPKQWRNTKIVHLAPIFNELDTKLVNYFSSNALLGITPQGWFRRRDESQIMSYAPWHAAQKVLSKASAVVLSPEDIGGDESELQKIIAGVPHSVVTLAQDGSILYNRGNMIQHFAPRPANLVDPTGAGDVFASAFFIKLYETGDPKYACQFANAAASHSVEGKGFENIPTRKQVEKNLNKIPVATENYLQ